MNAINYKKLEAIEAQRPLKVSDIFLAAKDITAPISFEEFPNPWACEKAVEEGYLGTFVESSEDHAFGGCPYYYLTTKGLNLIRKHMK